jgi:hypothetical protein
MCRTIMRMSCDASATSIRFPLQTDSFNRGCLPRRTLACRAISSGMPYVGTRGPLTRRLKAKNPAEEWNHVILKTLRHGARVRASFAPSLRTPHDWISIEL